MKKFYFIVQLVLFLAYLSGYADLKAQTYAKLPFHESFDNTWLSLNDTRDVPSLSWVNSPATGSNSWSREDDGLNRGAWKDTLGYYSVPGALGSSHSARFHSWSSKNNGTLDLFVDFSSLAGNKTLTYYYNNKDGKDYLNVLISIDGGKIFNKISTQTTAENWSKVVVSLGNINYSQAILRFEAVTDLGFTDIGIDEVSITGESTVVANFSSDITVTQNYPITVNFSDISSGNPTSWNWDFNNDGVIDATDQNPSFTFTNPGVYTVKLVASSQTSSDSVTVAHYIIINKKANLPFTEHFDDAWVNLKDTRDIPSLYWTNTPGSGNNSWSREDDGFNRGAWSNAPGAVFPQSGANGTTHSAVFHSAGTFNTGTLDLNVDFSSGTGTKTLSYYYINVDGLDSLEVYLSGDNGKTFKKIDSQKTSLTWNLVNVDLGDISYTNGVVRFLAKGDLGNTNIGIDEVSISGTGVSTDVKADFTSDLTTGADSLTVRFMDKSGNNPTSWKWDFNNDGTIDSEDQNPSFTFKAPGSYSVKLVVSNGVSSDSIVKYWYVSVAGKATVPFAEHFDDTWISFNDSLDVPGVYWKNNPAKGDNSWSRNDQGFSRKAWSDNLGGYTTPGANGTAHSARFHTFASFAGKQGILDLSIDFSALPYRDTLSYYYINPDGADSLEVFLSTDGGLSFVKVNSQVVQPDWAQVKVNLGDISSKNGIIRFVATSDWGKTDLGIDEVTVTGTKNYHTNFLTYSVPGQSGSAVIDSVNHTVHVEMPYGTQIASYAASFTISAGASVKVGSIDQISGSTVNDFTAPVIYSFTAEDGVSAQDWTVTVVAAKNNETDITAFSIDGETSNATIDATNHTIDVAMPYGTDVSALVASFTLSTGATVKIGTTDQVSGTTANNFASAVTYKVIAENGTTTQDWTVTVTVAKNDQTAVTAYSIAGQTGNATINASNQTIDVTMPYGTDVSALTASFTLSAGATAKASSTSQVSGTTTNDFTSSVVYSVTAENGIATQDWTVTVTVAKNDKTDIISFSVPNQEGATDINAVNRTVSVKIPATEDITSQVATFTLSAGATAKVGNTAQISGTTANDFTNAVTYVITAEDGTTSNDWTVTFTKSSGTSQTVADKEFTVFPNPSAGVFYVKMPQGIDPKATFEVYNLGGSKILTQEVQGSGNQQIDLTGNPGGVYNLIIRTKEKTVQIKLNLK